MPHHVVVDGSNIATEGRSQPSLKQLNEAVLAFMQEHPEALITVVVDATFGHRIDAREVTEFDEAVNNNELVAPPAGAIGRGDAFVLSIANKVNAIILTNDSYQEFHGQYDWLFDEGRLIGGKPVPHIGWVFVPRLPVRGPLSRKVTAEAKRRGRGSKSDTAGTVRVGSPDASLPMPVPTAPPPGAVLPGAAPAAVPAASKSAGRRGRGGSKAAAAADAAVVAAPAPDEVEIPIAEAAKAASPKGGGVNELMSFLSFVEHHPVGTSVNAIVDHYSSHGAYVKVGEVMGYVPLRLMASPAPRSAREFMKLGEAITLVVEKFVPEKRSIDLSVPGMGEAVLVESKPAKAAKAPRKSAKRAAEPVEVTPVVEPVADTPAPARAKRAPKKTAPAPVERVEVTPVVEAAPAKPAKKPAAKAAAKAAAPATKAPAAKAPATKTAPAAKDPATKTAPAAKVPATKVPATKAASTKAAATKAAATKAPTTTAAAKTAPAKKAAARKAVSKAAAKQLGA
jgi:hypothetical protein